MTFDTADGEVDLHVLGRGIRLFGGTGIVEDRKADHSCDDAKTNKEEFHENGGPRFLNAASLCPTLAGGNDRPGIE
jgi:hypothetical protein